MHNEERTFGVASLVWPPWCDLLGVATWEFFKPDVSHVLPVRVVSAHGISLGPGPCGRKDSVLIDDHYLCTVLWSTLWEKFCAVLYCQIMSVCVSCVCVSCVLWEIVHANIAMCCSNSSFFVTGIVMLGSMWKQSTWSCVLTNGLVFIPLDFTLGWSCGVQAFTDVGNFIPGLNGFFVLIRRFSCRSHMSWQC